MNMIKRIISIMTAAVLAAVCMAVSAPALAEESEDYEKYAFLSALDIISVTEDNADEKVSRARLAFIAAKAFCINSENGTNFMNYRDVDENTPYAGAIDAISGIRAAGGCDGYFYPNRTALTGEAVKIIITAMGYDFKAERLGGYPYGYFAAVPEISKGVKMSAEDELTLGVLAKMLYNVFEKPFPEKYISEGSIAELHHTYRRSGKITGNRFTRVSGGGTPDGFVEIDGEYLMETGATAAASLLGCETEYYYTTDGREDGMLLSVRVKAGVEKTIIESENIEGFSDGKYTYTENGKRRTASVSKGAYVLYNMSAVKEPFSDFVPSYGRVTLIENGGVCDFVLIEDYRIGIVDGVSASGINLKNGAPVLIDADKPQTFTVADKNGITVQLSDVSEWDTVIIEETREKDFCTVIYSAERSRGTVSASGESSGGKQTFIINDREYTAASDKIYISGTDKIRLNEEYELFIDAFGKVCGARRVQNGGLRYGYLKNAAMKKRLSSECELKIFTSDNEFKVFQTVKKPLFNNAKTNAEDIPGLLSKDGAVKRQLVRFEADDDGKIKRLETATSNSGGVNEGLAPGFRMVYSGASAPMRNVSEWLSGCVIYNGSTDIFVIPSDPENEDGYSYHTTGWFRASGSASVEAYTDNGRKIVSEAIIVKSNKDTNRLKDDLLLINSVRFERTQDGDTKLKLFGFFGTSEAEYFVSDDAVWCRVATLGDNEADETMPLADGMFAPGDVVKVRFDKYGEIDLIQFIYDESKQKYMLVSEEAPDAEPANPSTSSFASSYRFTYGAVYDKEDTAVLSVKGGELPQNVTLYSQLELFNTANCSIFKYNKDKKAFEQTKLGSAVSYKANPSSYDNALTLSEDGFTRSLILFESGE